MRLRAALLPVALCSCAAQPPAARPEAARVADVDGVADARPAAAFEVPCEAPLSAELAERAKTHPADRFHVGPVAPPSPARGGSEPADLDDRALADALLEAGKWTEVIPVLRRVAYDDPSPATGAIAAVRYLEALSRVAVAADRRSCSDRVFREAPELAARHCRGDDDRAQRAPCAVLLRAEIAVERKAIERLVEDADHREDDGKTFDEPGSRASLYDRAASGYADFAGRCCATTKRLGTDPREWRCDELAFNAVRAFRAARRLDRADEAEAWMLRGACGLGKTPLAERLRYDRKRRLEDSKERSGP